jgi:hypothetical protein
MHPIAKDFLKKKEVLLVMVHIMKEKNSEDKDKKTELENETHHRTENIRKNSLSEDGKFSCSAYVEISHLNNDNSCPICCLRSLQNQLTLQWPLC